MSTPNPNSQKPVHHLVQLSYATSLFAEQSVLLVGHDVSLAAFIASTGANVVAVSPEEADPPWPLLRAGDGMAHHVMPLDNLAFNDGVFGAAIIPNLSQIQNLKSVLSEVRRVLSRNGHLIAATPNPTVMETGASPIDYYKMYELLSGSFPVVQMIGQSAFNGYAVADLSNEDGELEVSFNSELFGNEAEEIVWFAAVSGNKKAELEPYAIVQVPSSAAGLQAKAEEIHRLEEELRNTRLELGNRGVRIESLEKKLEEELMQSEAARERAVKLSKDLDNERKAVTKKTLEDEYSKRSVDIDLNGALQSAKKELRLAVERAQSAEAARDEIIDRMRIDAADLDRLRRKLSDLETKPRRDPEIEKKIRLAEERAQSAEAARDEIIDRMRVDAAELDRLRDKITAMENRPQKPQRDPEVEKKLRLVEERAQSAEAARDDLIARMRADAAELDRLRNRHDECGSKMDALKKSENELREEVLTLRRQAEETEKFLNQKIEKEQSSETADEIVALEKENEALEKRLEAMAEKRRAAEEEAERQTTIVRDLVVRIGTLGQMEAIVPSAVFVASDRTSDTSDKVDVLETEIAALWGAKAGEHRARVEAELELTGQMVEIDKIKDNLATVNFHLKTRDEELKRMKEARDGLDDALRSATAECASLKEALAAAERESDAARCSNETALQAESREKDETCRQQELRIAEMESELQSSKWRIDELAARKADLEKQLEAATAEVAAAKASLSEKQQADEDRQSAEFMELKNRFADVEAENQRLSAALESVRRRERMLDEETESLTARSKTLRADLDESTSRMVSLTAELATAQEERERMTASLRRLTEQLDEEKQRRNQMDETVQAMTLEAALSRSKLQSADVELKGAHDKISDLSRAANSLKDESGRLAEVLDALDRRQAEVSLLREKLTAAEEKSADEMSRIQNLRADLEMLKAALATESEMTRLAGADAARASGEVESLQAKLARSTAAIAERDAEIATNLSVLAALREDLVQLTEKLKAVRADENRIRALTQELEALRRQSDHAAHELGEKEIVLLENRKALLEKESKLDEKEAQLGEKMSVLVEKESKLSEKESDLSEKEAQLSEKISVLVEKESKLSERESELVEKESKLREKAAELMELKEKECTLLTELTERQQEIEESAETLSEMEAKIVAVNQSKVGLSVELADAIQNSERLEAEIAKIKKKEAELGAESASLKLKLEQMNTLSLKRAEAAEQANKLSRDVVLFQKSLAEKEALIGSLTEQLEERERRASKLERQNRALNEQIQEHEGDVSAWDMELKLRSARISQLEKELTDVKSK